MFDTGKTIFSAGLEEKMEKVNVETTSINQFEVVCIVLGNEKKLTVEISNIDSNSVSFYSFPVLNAFELLFASKNKTLDRIIVETPAGQLVYDCPSISISSITTTDAILTLSTY